MKKKHLLLCTILLFICCSEREKVDRVGKKDYTMEVQPYKRFLLDKNTTQETPYVQLFTINDTLRFTMYNSAGHNILVYDIASGTVVDSITLHVEGPDNVGKNIFGYCICTMDSVYLYDYWQYTLIQVNRRGEIIRRINLSEKFLQPTEDCIVPASPYPRTDAPVRMTKGNSIILQGMGGNTGECEHPVCMVTALYSLSDSTVQFANPYPEVYGDHKKIVDSWGVFSYREVFYDLNNRDEMIVSFPADDHIVVYDVSSGDTRRFFAGYSAKDRILPVQGRSMAADLMHYMEQTQYAGVFFDPYRNLYYRLVAHPLYDYDVNDRETWKKKLSVVILDSRFNKTGEYDLEEWTDRCSRTFVSEEGLHIGVVSEDDDYLKFITLKPVKL
ncbi:MAG: DUF4221 domain-containing protein [Tannerella sp.]|jgi:hypothetical protein|nr:DUF4221 domain-containing protein [Tannerella sp.]